MNTATFSVDVETDDIALRVFIQRRDLPRQRNFKHNPETVALNAADKWFAATTKRIAAAWGDDAPVATATLIVKVVNWEDCTTTRYEYTREV